jgi:unsaturated rhamnogalacturonyl hydrolase
MGLNNCKSKMNRRQMIITTVLATATAFGKGQRKAGYQYLLAKVDDSKPNLPNGKYIPFDWGFSEISNENDGIKLTWQEHAFDKKSLARLRITSATDVREALVLEVKTAISNQKIADWDLQFAAYMQPFDLEIPREILKTVLSEGITLKLKKELNCFGFFQKIVQNQPQMPICRICWCMKRLIKLSNHRTVGKTVFCRSTQCKLLAGNKASFGTDYLK